VTKCLPHAALLIAAAGLASCGGGNSTRNPIQGASPGGIWRGTDSMSGLAILGLVDEVGESDFMRADNTQFIGQASTSDSAIYASGGAYAHEGNTFPDGSTHGNWSLNGTIQERQSISATTQLTTDAGTVTSGTMDLTFDTLYNQPSSTATVAGTYLDSQAQGFPIFIDTDGSIQQSELICQTGGHISIIDPSYNLYRVQLTTKCDNGSNSSGSGLATLDNSVSPVQLLVGLSGGGTAGAFIWIRQ
jgi:hypothetical protein